MDSMQAAKASRAPRVIDTREAWLDIPATAPDHITEYKRYNNQRRRMVPRVIHDTAEWELRTLVVHGNPLKKDGTPAQTETESQVVVWGNQEQDIPAWLKVAINAIQPGWGK